MPPELRMNFEFVRLTLQKKVTEEILLITSD
jgi:hypothetical protein